MGVDLSFILVNWNTKGLVLEALRSIYHTAHGYRFEVVVVDNGSEDGSPEAIKETFPHVSLILNEENLGFAKATNQALAQAAGRYIFLLNSDARLTEGAVQALVNFMEDNPDVGIAGGQLVNEDGSKQNSIAPFPSLATELLNKRLLRILFPRRYPGKERSYPSPIDVGSLVGACIVVRRQAIDEVGWLDEGYFFFMEETDWCFRMRDKGWRVCFVPHAQILHLQGASVAMAKTEAKIEFCRSRYLFFAKHRGRVRTTLFKLGLMLRLLGEVLSNALLLWRRRYRERWKTSWRLLLWHFNSCPSHEGLRGVKYVKTAHQKN
ncbi:MAG: glycosyltransferase family 2 protein [Deltaproteobacteria bacterium]|nr:MAG: glycosyltransferase family 2 protein [Deltaproteobacteria bacterium]